MIEAYLVPIEQLDAQDKTSMFLLFTKHFLGVDWQSFLTDLQAKNWAILLKEADDLKGFSTLQCYPSQWQDQTIRVVYSGDTITDPSMWSSPALAQAWTKAIQLIHQGRSEKLYWLLISSGYRTYRFLTVFAKCFYPHGDRQTPPSMQALIDQLAREKFPTAYDPDTGIVRFPYPQILQPHLRHISPAKQQNPHVAYFMRRNPGHSQGDELVCLAEVSVSNLTKAGLRLWNSRYPLHSPFAAEM